MTKKCCYYEVDGEEEMICYSGSECPDYSNSGWKFIGSWSVENCEDCPEELPVLKPGPTFDISLIDKFRMKLRYLKENIQDLIDRMVPFDPPDLAIIDKFLANLKNLEKDIGDIRDLIDKSHIGPPDPGPRKLIDK